ncbi:hypothetical protein Tco_0236637 [Tanacetum coccineum]
MMVNTQERFSRIHSNGRSLFQELIIKNLDFIEKYIIERALHDQEIHNKLKRMHERKLQIQECKVQKVKATDASSGDTYNSGIVSDKWNDQKPMAEVRYTAEYNVFVVGTQHSKQPENINDTHVMEKGDSNVTPDSSNMCDNDNQADQNAEACDDKRVALANLIANLKLDIDEKKDSKAIKERKRIIDSRIERCLYQHKIKECECLAEKLSKQTKIVSKEVYNELLRSFAKLENYSISLELALQLCQEQMKNDTVCKQNGSIVFLKEREQYFEIQDLKAQLQDKNIAISELKKLIEKMKGSNDMVHNYYLEEAKNNAQLQKNKALNIKPSVQRSARLPNTANDTTAPSYKVWIFFWSFIRWKVFTATSIKFQQDLLLHMKNSFSKDTQPTVNIHPSTEPITHTITIHTKENTDIQAEIQLDNAHVDDDEFYNVFSTPVREEAESPIAM